MQILFKYVIRMFPVWCNSFFQTPGAVTVEIRVQLYWVHGTNKHNAMPLREEICISNHLFSGKINLNQFRIFVRNLSRTTSREISLTNKLSFYFQLDLKFHTEHNSDIDIHCSRTASLLLNDFHKCVMAEWLLATCNMKYAIRGVQNWYFKAMNIHNCKLLGVPDAKTSGSRFKAFPVPYPLYWRFTIREATQYM